jgi:hypothetical protein
MPGRGLRRPAKMLKVHLLWSSVRSRLDLVVHAAEGNGYGAPVLCQEIGGLQVSRSEPRMLMRAGPPRPANWVELVNEPATELQRLRPNDTGSTLPCRRRRKFAGQPLIPPKKPVRAQLFPCLSAPCWIRVVMSPKGNTPMTDYQQEFKELLRDISQGSEEAARKFLEQYGGSAYARASGCRRCSSNMA